MNKIFSYISNNQTIKWVTYIVAAFFIVSLYNRYIYIDDAWFGEQAYWFSKLGYVKTSTIIDFHGWDNRLFVYHKLNIIIGAALIQLFGWSVQPLRIFTLIIFLIFIYVLNKSLTCKKGPWNSINANFVFFFLIVNPQTILYAFTYRPEILVMSLGFFSFLLLFGEQSYKKIIFSGALAGMAILVHLNGSMFVIAGFMLLLIRKEIKMALIFGIASTIITSLYFYDLYQIGHFDTFLFQIGHWPDDITTNYRNAGWESFVMAIIIKLSNEHQRFFWSHDVWGLSAMTVLALLAKGSLLWKKHKYLIIYFIIADVSLNIFGSHIAEVNMILLMPFLVLISAAFLTELKISSSSFLQLIVTVIVLFQISVVIFGFVNIFSKNENIASISKSVLEEFPENNEKILVPYRFVFNQLPYKNLVTYKTMEYHQVENNKKFTKAEFIDLATVLGIKYMVVSPEMYAKNEGMYPWMLTEFKDFMGSSEYVKLKINKDKKILEIIE